MHLFLQVTSVCISQSSFLYRQLFSNFTCILIFKQQMRAYFILHVLTSILCLWLTQLMASSIKKLFNGRCFEAYKVQSQEARDVPYRFPKRVIQ